MKQKRFEKRGWILVKPGVYRSLHPHVWYMGNRFGDKAYTVTQALYAGFYVLRRGWLFESWYRSYLRKTIIRKLIKYLQRLL